MTSPTVPPRRSTLTKRLRAIERMRAAERGVARKGKPTAKPRWKLTPTRKRRAQLKLQGSYMGFMRQLKPAQKLRVKAVKEKRGFEAAIRLASGIAKGR